MNRLSLALTVAMLLCATSAFAKESEDPTQDVATLIETLNAQGAPEAGEAAAKQLAKLGATALPALRLEMMGSSAYRRAAVAKVVGQMDASVEGAEKILIEALDDDWAGVVDAAIEGLIRFGTPTSMSRVASALTRITDEKRISRIYSAYATSGVAGHRALSSLVLRDHDRRADIKEAMTAAGANAHAAWTALSQDPRWRMRVWAVHASPKIKTMPSTWISALHEATRDESSAVRCAASRRLSHTRHRTRDKGYEPTDPRVVPILLSMLNDSNHLVARCEGAYGLGQIGPLDNDTVQALIQAISIGDPQLVRNAACALENAPSLDSVQAALVPILDQKESEAEQGSAAAATLVHHGYVGSGVIPFMLRFVGNKLWFRRPFKVFMNEHRELGIGGGRRRFGIGSVAWISVSRKAFKRVMQRCPDLLESRARTGEDYHRYQFLYALAALGKPALEPLARLLTHEDSTMRLCTACCLASLGGDGVAAVPVLLPQALLETPVVDDDVVYLEESIKGVEWILESREALVSIGKPALKAVEAAAAKSAVNAERLKDVLDRLRKK